MSLLKELEWRGLVHQTTATDLDETLSQGPITLYNGYDPTAASLHVGHLLPLTLMKHFAHAGHRVIALVGGGTGQIGDPSGKSSERNLLGVETARQNAASLMRQITRFLSSPKVPPLYANNEEWLGSMGLLRFLRETGKHFSVNAMIQKDAVQSRLERDGEGISFTEFSYSLLQAHDFLELYRRYGCLLQTGGSDQWGNIVAGVELIRRVEGVRAFGLTVPLLLNSDGKKFGKSEKGAVFLDPELTSPYRFYQFWVNMADEDVVRYLKLFTFLSPAEIEDLGREVGSGARSAQKKLAWSMTEAVHGASQADKAAHAAEVLFSGDIRDVPSAMLKEIFADAPTTELAADRLANPGLSLVDLLVEIGACASRGDARRQIQQGAVKLNGVLVLASNESERRLCRSDIREGNLMVVRKGKRNTYLVRLTSEEKKL